MLMGVYFSVKSTRGYRLWAANKKDIATVLGVYD